MARLVVGLVVGLVAAALLLPRALAADAPDPAVTAQNRQIVAATPDAEGVFAVQDDGAIRHLQSGLVCPAKYPNLSFYHALVYASPAGRGTDVGCDYRRADALGGAWSKLTIFAVKAAPGTTLDQAYERYRGELTQAMPDAQPQGEAIRIENKGGAPSSFPDIRSQEYLIVMNDQRYTSELVVAIVGGWIIEIRATFVGLPNTLGGTREGSGDDVLAAEGGDRFMSTKALVDAVSTIVP